MAKRLNNKPGTPENGFIAGCFGPVGGCAWSVDVNAALNLIQKAVPDAFGPGPEAGGHGMADWVVNPVQVTRLEK